MRCYNCKKNFDYEKYYGICPKCGCYNKKETEEEQHQQYHDQYDGGYTHKEETSYEEGENYRSTVYRKETYRRETYGEDSSDGENSSYEYETVGKTGLSGSTKFLLISFIIAIAVFVCGTALGMIYESVQENKAQEKAMSGEAVRISHGVGEEFSMGKISLCAEEAKVLATDEELDIPAGKQMIAVKMSCKGIGVLPEMYIFSKGSYYRQIRTYDYEPYGNVFHCPTLVRTLYSATEEEEGWVAFLADQGAESVTLCVEERTGEDQVYLGAVHTIDVLLKEE